jgi:hypothetical protein
MRICTLIVATMWVCAPAGAADETKPAELKPSGFKQGWKEDDFKAFSGACTDAIVNPAMQAYQDRVTASGRTDAKPFPEKELRESVAPMCECITHRLAETWTLREVADTTLEKSKPFVEEALAGGQCKPGGMLGQMLEQARASAPATPATPAAPAPAATPASPATPATPAPPAKD